MCAVLKAQELFPDAYRQQSLGEAKETNKMQAESRLKSGQLLKLILLRVSAS